MSKPIYNWPVGVVELFAIMLIGLKLTGKLNGWSWWLILAPLWVPYTCRMLSGALIYTAEVVRAANLNRAEKEKEEHDKETGNRR